LLVITFFREVFLSLLLLGALILGVHGQSAPLSDLQKKELKVYFKKIYDQEVASISSRESSVKKAIAEACKKRYEKETDLVESDLLLLNSPLQLSADSLVKDLASVVSLKRPLRVFVTRELAANAYSTGDGNLFVSIGLMAKLHTRDELVFVLAHEIAHDQLDHFTKSQEDRARLVTKDFDADLKRASRSEMQRYTKMGVLVNSKLSELNSFSRLYEFEADSLGNKFIEAIGLTHNSAVLTLSELEHIDKESVKPVLDIKAIAKRQLGEIDEEWFVGETSSLGNMVYKEEELPDSLRTHPDIKLRIAKFSGVAAIVEVPEAPVTEYAYIQRQAEKECLYSWLVRGDYGRSYYLAERLAHKGETEYSPLVAAISLSLLAIHSQRHDLGYHLQHEANLYSEPYNLCLRMLNEFTVPDYIRLSESYLKMVNEDNSAFSNPSDFSSSAQYLICLAKKQTVEIKKWEEYYLKHFPDGILSAFIQESKK
jgi:Zn-dependent protease with chaperone function